jgi:hypothetical protein
MKQELEQMKIRLAEMLNQSSSVPLRKKLEKSIYEIHGAIAEITDDQS